MMLMMMMMMMMLMMVMMTKDACCGIRNLVGIAPDHCHGDEDGGVADVATGA